MESLRTYGNPPYSTAVIHGGPGAAGDMAPVAIELSCEWGVLEPLQRSPSVDGQVFELFAILLQNAALPVALIGHSWGAWLGYILSARHPGMVKKLILVGSGPFEEQYVSLMNETRLHRLTVEERNHIQALTRALDDPGTKNKNDILKELGETFSRTDSFNPVYAGSDSLDIQPEIFLSVMQEAHHLRKSGALLEMGRLIECPVVAIHGDYDPHPSRGVAEPLSRILHNFQLILLKNCGHYPWKEQNARDNFYSVLKRELK